MTKNMLLILTREHLNGNVTQIPITFHNPKLYGSLSIQPREGTSINAQNFQKLSKNCMKSLSNIRGWNDVENNFPCRDYNWNVAEIYNDVRTAYPSYCIVYVLWGVFLKYGKIIRSVTSKF